MLRPLIYFCCFLFFCGCISKKKFSLPTSEGSAINRQFIQEKIFEDLELEWFSGKAKLKFTQNGQTNRATAFIKVRRDSFIWMSFKKYSVEGARTFITKDSIYILNRQEKTYIKSNTQALEYAFGFWPPHQDLENLLLAKVPQVDTTQLWEYKEDENFYQFRSAKDGIIFTFAYDKFTGLLRHGDFMDGFSLNGNWTYEDFRAVNEYILPYKRTYSFSIAENNFVQLELEFSDISIDEIQEVKFQIPNHYSVSGF